MLKRRLRAGNPEWTASPEEAAAEEQARAAAEPKASKRSASALMYLRGKNHETRDMSGQRQETFDNLSDAKVEAEIIKGDGCHDLSTRRLTRFFEDIEKKNLKGLKKAAKKNAREGIISA